MRLPILFVILLFVASIACDWYILTRIRRNTSSGSVWRRVWLWSSVVCWAFLTVTVCMPRRDGDADIIPVMWMLYSYLSVYIVKFMVAIFSIIGGIPRLWKGKTWRTGVYVGLPLGLICFGLLWWGACAGRRNINVERVEIEFPGLPESFDGMTVVQFSDLHTGTWGSDTTFVSAFVDSINSLKPDLILFTGDIVNRQTSELEPFLKVLSRLKAPKGVYSILGNHDYGDYVDWADPSARDANNALMEAWQRQMGWNLLNNRSVFLTSEAGDSIVLIGVENWGEPPFPQYGDLDKAYPADAGGEYHQNDDRFKILMSHDPEHWNREVSGKTNIDLTLSGHTHAMQMMVSLGDWRWSPSSFKYDQWGGLYKRPSNDGDSVCLYVNIGSGEVGMPARIGADPEITLFTLRSGRR